jgi:hypothetical protein
MFMRLSRKSLLPAMLLSGLIVAPALAQRAPARRPTRQQTPAKATGTSSDLRAEWNMGDLKLTKEAVDDGNFPPDIKSAAIQAVDWFTGQQESLLAGVDKDPKAEAGARKTRAQLEQQFNGKMKIITADAKFQAELTRQLKALNKEMDDMASSADKMFANLDAVGVTKDQKAKLTPAIKEANAQLKTAAGKTATKSVKDRQARDDAAKALQSAHAQLKATLTKAQRDKLAAKLAADKDKEDGK